MASNVSRRRVQRLGGSSLIVTLPKAWVKRVGLKVGDTLVIIDEGDHLKVLPSKTKPSTIASSVRVRLSSFLKDAPLESLIDCAYTKGVRRLQVELPTSEHNNADLIVSKLRSHPLVKEVTQSYPIDGASSLVVELAEDTEENLSKLLKVYNSIIQEVIDAATRPEGSGLSKGLIEERFRHAQVVIDTIIRKTYKNGAYMCDAETIDPSVIGLLKALTALMKELLLKVLELGKTKEMDEVLNRMKFVLSESIGGVASGSGKRLINAFKEASELKRQLDSLLERHDYKLAVLASIAKNIIAIVEVASLRGLCSSSIM